MLHKLKTPFLLLISLCYYGLSHAQQIVYADSVYRTNIHSVQLSPTDNPETIAVMSLHSTHALLLQFDELSSEYHDYMYSFTHCNADWTASELSTSEYMQGFEEGTIEDYSFSQNTKIDYVHYRLSFPQEDMIPLVSGNYILSVYEAEQANSPVLSCRFMVVEPGCSISGHIKHSDLSAYRNTHQEVDFKVNIQRLGQGFPAKDIQVNMMRNNDWHSLHRNLQALEVSDGVMNFDLQNDANTFWGLNRFRYFDFSSQKYNSEYIDHIVQQDDTTRIVLLGCEPRSHDKFAEQINMQGYFAIDNKDWDNALTESEYSRVYFTLYYPVPLPYAQVYIMGAFNQWKMNKDNRMHYDYEQKAYVGSLLLKQGFYSYLFMLYDTQKKSQDYIFFENSFFDTDNFYNIMVYYREPGSIYDRLVGFKRLMK